MKNSIKLLLALALGVTAMCNTSLARDKDNPKDSITVREGKMMVMKDGTLMPMTETMTLDNGTKVMMDCSCVTADGQKMTMKEGDVMCVDGTMMKSDAMKMDAAMMKDCVMMKDGKMMVMKDGTTTAMTHTLTLDDGTKVMTDGTVMTKDGEKSVLKDGEMMSMDGKAMKHGM